MATLGTSTFPGDTSTTPSCTCRSAVLELQITTHGRNFAVDDTLNTARHAIDTWPRLRNCPRCLQTHLGDLLDVFRQLVDSLQHVVADTQSQRQALTGAPRTVSRGEWMVAIDTATTAGDSRSGAALPARRDNSGSKQTVPIAVLGNFKLDEKQSSGLIHKVCLDLLSRLAAALYEVQGIGTGVDGHNEGALTGIMFTVLRLIDSLEQYG